MRVIAACALILACFTQASGQQGDGQTPTFRGGISFVRVDVIVTDGRAQPIVDLKQTDFEILEDGKPQTIEQFRLVKVDGNLTPGGPPPRQIRSLDDEELEASREDSRLFVIFLDDYHVTLINSMRVREPLIRFVRNQLGPNDLVAIMYPLTPLSALAVTRNHDAIVTALQRFEGRKCDSVPCDYTPRHPPEENYAHYPPATIERIRTEVVISALEGLAVRLGSLREGRKSVVYVSEGLGISPASAHYELREALTAANRNNVAIYSLDPRGLTVGNLRASQESLLMLSEETDGRAIVNRNTLEQGLGDMVRDSSYYYLIGYNSTQMVNDGKFHEINVRVKRSGTDVRSRKGYWALSAADAIRATAAPTPDVANPVKQALASIATSVQAAKYVRTWLGTERGANGKTRVMLVWEPLPAPGRREQPARVSLLAADATGNLVFRGGESDAAAWPQRLVFEAAPGKIELRMTVEATGTGGTLDSEIRTIDVPDFTAPQAAISTPRVFRTRTGRDMQALLADAGAVPVAMREFSRTERLVIRFDAYGAGTDRPEATAVLMNRAGQKMSDLAVTPAPAGGTHQLDLGLASIPAGEYLVEITVKGASGEVKELVALRVTS